MDMENAFHNEIEEAQSLAHERFEIEPVDTLMAQNDDIVMEGNKQVETNDVPENRDDQLSETADSIEKSKV